jgi:hypothetical protein
MSRLRGHRTEAPDPTFDRRLTARLAVLAKRSEPDRLTPVLTVDGPGRTYPKERLRPLAFLFGFWIHIGLRLQAIPAALTRVLRRGDNETSTRLRPFSLAR